MSTTALQDPPERSTSRPKAVLFCPECGHADHVDGAWTVLRTDEHDRYECPECGTTVVVQPRL